MAKATKKQALGRGLSALLNDPGNDIQTAKDKNADKVIGNIIELELELIEIWQSLLKPFGKKNIADRFAWKVSKGKSAPDKIITFKELEKIM